MGFILCCKSFILSPYGTLSSNKLERFRLATYLPTADTRRSIERVGGDGTYREGEEVGRQRLIRDHWPAESFRPQAMAGNQGMEMYDVLAGRRLAIGI